MSTHNRPIKPHIAGERFLSLRDVETITSLKKSTIYGLIAAGTFPRPSRLTVRRSGWLASDVEDWIESRLGRSAPSLTMNPKMEVVL